ncbi:polysaccharide export protein [Flammeovirgaceae bacterium 311]|nr:polysaccharide export protein [Flammeovirgaceae bacterium 311]
MTGDDYARLKGEMIEAERTYTIQPNDLLEIDVYTNKGERIIDPDFELARELGGGNMQQQRMRQQPQYLVQPNGEVVLPMVGNTALAGYSLRQADSVLALAFSSFYKSPFVFTRYVNKRIVVLGSTGGQVIPLTNQNMNLLEVIALAGGISRDGKAHNIRLIRGDLNNPHVQLIDLTTIEGMRQASLQVQSGDIVYIEPIRRLLPETIRDVAPVLGLISNVIGLTLVIISLSNNN